MKLKTIPGFSNYSVTRDGKIWSGKRQRFLRPGLVCGYFAVKLCKDSKPHTKQIHRLVLETFVGSCPDGMECCHYNGIKTDNRLKNLRWGTRSSNAKDSIRHGTHACLRLGENNNATKLTESEVRIIIYMYRTGLFLQQEIAKVYNVGQVTISNIITKRNWKHI